MLKNVLDRVGAKLNAHVHLHACILDGVVVQGRQGLVFRGARVEKLVCSAPRCINAGSLI